MREVDKNERSKSEISQAYGIPLIIVSTYLKIVVLLSGRLCKDHNISE
jgi:hypothetical protein